MLQNKVAIVTGSTSGIGLGIAQSLAKQGCSIVLNGLIDAQEAQKLKATFEDEFKVKVHLSFADMTKPEEIKQMVDETITLFGRVDVLVNNAGIQHVAPIESFPPEKWDAILAINLTSSFHTIRHSLPHMKKNNWGRIINVASAHGLVASAQKTAYVAAKHGLVGLTKAVALETAQTGITCNAICPGWVLTPLVEKQIQAISKNESLSMEAAKSKLLAEKQPSHEFVTSEQIGQTALFLCSSAADQIRGTAINIDGGWVAQ
jgi:3-hydroxybutyrate dehydrogenase